MVGRRLLLKRLRRIYWGIDYRFFSRFRTKIKKNPHRWGRMPSFLCVGGGIKDEGKNLFHHKDQGGEHERYALIG
jgi:hypothetical protein